MLYHVKELQFNARVSKPDPRFASLLLEQFGGANGELKAAMTYFTQAFGAKNAHPDKYDLLMDIATEEFNHLEIVGATIQMLLTGINGDLKNAAEQSEIMALLDGKQAMETDQCGIDSRICGLRAAALANLSSFASAVSIRGLRRR